MEAIGIVLLGLPMTALVTASAFVFGLLGGVPLVLGLRSGSRLLRLTCRTVVDVIRGVPTIVWLFILYFGVTVGDFRFSPLSAAVVGLGVISSAYLAEMYRGGFATIPSGQSEAAHALGLARSTVFVRVLAPQALRTAIPSVTTYLIALVKDSSIASTIGVTEMVYQATDYTRQNPGTAGLTPFLAAAAVYVVVSIPLAVVSRRIDGRLHRSF